MVVSGTVRLSSLQANVGKCAVIQAIQLCAVGAARPQARGQSAQP
jgi:hypothetical protein